MQCTAIFSVGHFAVEGLEILSAEHLGAQNYKN